MSDEQEENVSEEEEEEDEEEDEEEQEEEEDEEGEEDGSQEEEQEEGSGDQDQNSEQENSDDEEEGGEQEDASQVESKAQQLPKFRSIEPEQLKFSSLLSEISSLSVSVDHFIGSLPSHGGSGYRKYIPPVPREEPPRVPLVLPEESRVVIMKDEDIQVTMQPQIVIQPTKKQKPAEPAYKISNESNKFLAQLYEENRKLKRWTNSSHNMNSHKAGSSVSGGFYGSRERFERKQYEKGLFDVDERNRQIDDAIQMLQKDEDS